MRRFFEECAEQRAERREGEAFREAKRDFEGMTKAFEDRDYETALLLADRTIAICRRLYAGNDTWVYGEALADRLRYRAEIRQEIGDYTRALPDAEEAATLLERDPGDRYPLARPSTRLMVCELYAALGDHDGAMRYADAIDAFWERLPSDEPRPTVEATGLARYALAMFAVGEVDQGATVAWEALALYWPMLRALSRRDTLVQFARAVYQLALHGEPPTAEAAPRLLLALQDAASAGVIRPAVTS
jgi:tetratricopeptide (TPR) repeat protein